MIGSQRFSTFSRWDTASVGAPVEPSLSPGARLAGPSFYSSRDPAEPRPARRGEEGSRGKAETSKAGGDHRITQNSRGWKGPLWVTQSNPPAEAGSPTASCTGPCPGGSGISPEKETPQPLWAA